MKRIELYKSDGKSEKQVNKTIREIADELEKRLESQELKPDFSFLSPDFKKIQKNAFPINNNVTGMLSVSNDMVVATVSVMDKDNPEVKGRMLNAQYKIEAGEATEAFDKATTALKLMVQSFWMNVDEKQQLQKQQLQNKQDKQQVKQENQEQPQSNKSPGKEQLASAPILQPNGDNSNAQEVAQSIQKALANPNVLNQYNLLLRANYFEIFDKFMDRNIRDNYMYMGKKDLEDTTIYTYKNALNREFICLDREGNFYDINGDKISRERALTIAVEPVSSSVALNIPVEKINVKASANLIKKQMEDVEEFKNDKNESKTVTLSTGAKALVDEKTINRYSTKQANTPIASQSNNQEHDGNSNGISSSDSNKNTSSNTNNSNNSNLKNQLINVNFTPEQAEVVIQLLEENQKKYEPKSSMFGLLGDVLGKMLHALSRKLDEMIDAEKVTTEKLNSIYSVINNENCKDFSEKYGAFNQKIKYCHDFICEAAQGQSIQSTDIINQILNREKVPVSIRTLQNAFVTAVDNNLESALTIFKYADANLHGEAHFDTMRGFLSHSLNTLSDTDAEKFIKASSFRALDDTVIFKEMIRAEKYDLLNSSLQRCENIDEHAPSLFYFAAQRKDVDALHMLISKGANVNANSSEALYACFETNKVEAAKVLINYGADIELVRSRVEQIKRANPNNIVDKDNKLITLTESDFNFLKDIYKYCGLTEDGTKAIQVGNEPIEQKQQVEQAVDNESDEYDGSQV